MRQIAFKQRIIGAIFILALGVILIPVILDSPSETLKIQYSSKPRSPDLPETSEVSKINYVFNDIVQIPQVSSQLAQENIDVKINPVYSEIKPEPKTSPLMARVEGDWTIQLGAFSSSDNAKELLQRLSKEGFDSYLKDSPGSKVVRVFVAPGIDKNAAQELVTKLDAEFGIKGIVVRYREQ